MIAGSASAVVCKINPAIAALQDIERTMREGTGAARQLAAHERTYDMKAVVDETYEGLTLAQGPEL